MLLIHFLYTKLSQANHMPQDPVELPGSWTVPAAFYQKAAGKGEGPVKCSHPQPALR